MLALSILLICSTTPRASEMPRVRAVDPWLARLLADGAASSATFKAIADRVQRSDVIVHIEPWADGRPAGVSGRLRFVGLAGGFRYLRVSIAMPLTRTAALAVLGHELQHAAEVADDSSVIDRVSFQALYRRIGDGCHTQAGPRYDTRAAREAGRQVLAELRSAHRKIARR